MIGNPAATAYRLTTSPFRYPAPPRGPHKDKVDGLYLCPFSSCSRAKSTPESATFHHDCFEVFKSACTGADALDRLWSFAVWQRPWRDAARIFLPRKPAICSAGVGAAARALGLRAFAERLPVEIASMVYEYSESATFWRLASALDLAAQFSAAGERGITTHALRRVASWERGQAPVLSREQHQFPIIRLTIDALGIKSVERLPGDEPPLSKARSDNLAFVIEHQADIGPGHVVVLFKVGRRYSFMAGVYNPAPSFPPVPFPPP